MTRNPARKSGSEALSDLDTSHRNAHAAAVNTAQALDALGARPALLEDRHRTELDVDGFTVIESVLDSATIDEVVGRIDYWLEVLGDKAGEPHPEEGTDRLYDMVNKDPVFDVLWLHPVMLAAARHVLSDEEIHFSSLNYRAAKPGQGLQGLHSDGGVTEPEGHFTFVIGTWCLSDFTVENGATRGVPGTHRARQLPQEALADTVAAHPDERVLTGRRGDLIVFNAHLWHAGTMNKTEDARRGAFPLYSGRHLGQQMDQQAALKPETWDRLSPAGRYLLDIQAPVPATANT